MLIAIKLIEGHRTESKVLKLSGSSTVKSLLTEHFKRNEPNVKECYAGIKSHNFDTKKICQIDCDMPISLIMNTIDVEQIVVICLQNVEIPKVAPTNAFSVLMTAQTKNVQLVKIAERNAKDSIHNHIIDYLNSKNITFQACDLGINNNFVKSLADILWLLDGQASKFKKVPDCPDLPLIFFTKTFRVLTHQNVTKKKIPNMRRQDLVDACIKLETIINSKADKRGWDEVIIDLTNLKSSIDYYADYLQASCDKDRSEPQDQSKLKIITGDFALSAMHTSTYASLRAVLIKNENYFPILLTNYAPVDRRMRYNYIRRLQFAFPIQLFHLSKPHAYHVWKLPTDHLTYDDHESKIAALIRKLCSDSNLKIIRETTKEKLYSTFEHNSEFKDYDFDNIASYFENGE